MDSETKSLIHSMSETVEENNKILHKLQRKSRYATIMSIVYWLIIFGISIGSYYYIEPYFKQLVSIYGSVQKDLGNAGQIKGSIEQLKEVLKNTGK